MKSTATGFLAALLACGAVLAQQPENRGITPRIKLEETVFGHLTELNGKFKLRVTELSFAPGARLGPHHHAGPGIRMVTAGALTFVQAGKETVYGPGDYFYESGNVVHTAENRTKAPVRVTFFEILPVDWSGPTVILPKAH
ncbi:MAG TPA: cupin domain-containing protein [Burkholderiales bacterium]|nr:cupin domain-containing protein [Burkholderiales bacterium]